MNPGIISTMIKRWGRGYIPARRKIISELVSTGWTVVLKVRSSEHCVYQRSFQRFFEVNIVFIIILRLHCPFSAGMTFALMIQKHWWVALLRS